MDKNNWNFPQKKVLQVWNNMRVSKQIHFHFFGWTIPLTNTQNSMGVELSLKSEENERWECIEHEKLKYPVVLCVF